jgi:hypothetical protein
MMSAGEPINARRQHVFLVRSTSTEPRTVRAYCTQSLRPIESTSTASDLVIGLCR